MGQSSSRKDQLWGFIPRVEGWQALLTRMDLYVRPASLTPRNDSERFSPPGGPDKPVKALKHVESGRVEQQIHDVGGC